METEFGVDHRRDVAGFRQRRCRIGKHLRRNIAGVLDQSVVRGLARIVGILLHQRLELRRILACFRLDLVGKRLRLGLAARVRRYQDLFHIQRRRIGVFFRMRNVFFAGEFAEVGHHERFLEALRLRHRQAFVRRQAAWRVDRGIFVQSFGTRERGELFVHQQLADQRLDALRAVEERRPAVGGNPLGKRVDVGQHHLRAALAGNDR